MKTIYNTPQGKQKILALYDEQLSRLKTIMISIWKLRLAKRISLKPAIQRACLCLYFMAGMQRAPIIY